MHKQAGFASLQAVSSDSSQLSSKDRCVPPVGGHCYPYDAADDGRLMPTSPPLLTRGKEQERLLGTPRADDSHSTLAGLPQLAGAGIERRSGGSGVSDVALGARPQPAGRGESPPAGYDQHRPRPHGYDARSPLLMPSTSPEAFRAQVPGAFEWAQPPNGRMMPVEAPDNTLGFGGRQASGPVRIQTGGSSGLKRKLDGDAQLEGTITDRRMPSGGAAPHSSQAAHMAGFGGGPAYSSAMPGQPPVAPGDSGGASLLSPVGRSLLLRQQLQQLPPGDPVRRPGHRGSNGMGQPGMVAPTGSLAANLAMIPCAMQNIVHLNPGEGSTAALRHLAEGIISAQGALEDKLAHVMVERDAYAAQLADMRRYQGGRITVSSGAATAAPPVAGASQQTPGAQTGTAAKKISGGAVEAAQQGSADGAAADADAAVAGAGASFGSRMAAAGAIVPPGLSVDMVPREHLQRVQAQLNAATEVGEAFNKSRGDVRRERKLMQKVAALEEEVRQLKGQLLHHITAGPRGEQMPSQSAQDTSVTVARGGVQQQQKQQEKEAEEESAKEQNEELAAALNDEPLECLGRNDECSTRLASLQTGVKQMRGQRDAALKALRRTKQLKEEQAAKLTELSVGFESMVLEFQKCNRSIQQLEVKSLWKANELRAALAREGQLSADLESARCRIAAMEDQGGAWSHADGDEAAADRDEARAKLAVAVARIAELQSIQDAKTEGNVDHGASASLAQAAAIAQQTSMFSSQISSLLEQLRKAQGELSNVRPMAGASAYHQHWRAQEDAIGAARGVASSPASVQQMEAVQRETEHQLLNGSPVPQHGKALAADTRSAMLAAELESTQLQLQNAKNQAQAFNEELSWVRHHINAMNYRCPPPEPR